MENSGQSEKPLSVEQEYELWKSNVPLLYDFVSETNLTWPTLTLEWMPQSANVDKTRQHLIIGTHTADEEQNYLKIAAIDFPREVVEATMESEDPEGDAPRSNIKIVKKFEHQHEVIRARYMPQEKEVVATVNGEGTVFVYDTSKSKNNALRSTLKFHKEEGYGLSFNPNSKGELLSGSNDGTVALWDILSDALNPVRTWETTHTDIVNDCRWHEFDQNLFASVSEDSTLQLHDCRNRDSLLQKVQANKPYNTVAFSKHSENILAAAGTDFSVYIYDRRNMETPLHAMAGHEDAVTSLEFSPLEDGIVMTSGSDRRVIVWDLREIGAEQQPDEADDGPPEILMIHAGHRSPINDISVNPNIPWLMASAEENNTVHAWKCSSKLPRVGGIPHVDGSLLIE